MSRQLQYYHRTRTALIRALGGKCEHCGATRALEVDHLQPRPYKPSKLSSSSRIARYVREARAGKVQLLCKCCNAEKGEPPETDDA